MHNQFLLKIITPPLVVLVLHIVATLAGWYELIWWFDKPMHLIGGVAIAITAHYIISYFSNTGQLILNWKPLTLLVIFSMVALAAVSWELLEFYLDRISFPVMQPSIHDTMTDLLMGMFGGTITGTVITYFKRK